MPPRGLLNKLALLSMSALHCQLQQLEIPNMETLPEIQPEQLEEIVLADQTEELAPIQAPILEESGETAAPGLGSNLSTEGPLQTVEQPILPLQADQSGNLVAPTNEVGVDSTGNIVGGIENVIADESNNNIVVGVADLQDPSLLSEVAQRIGVELPQPVEPFLDESLPLPQVEIQELPQVEPLPIVEDGLTFTEEVPVPVEPIQIQPISVPVDPVPVPEPILQSPVVTLPLSVQPLPIETLPIEQPIETLPIEQPIVTLPIEDPIVTLPIEEPIVTLPIEQPIVTLPIEQPVIQPELPIIEPGLPVLQPELPIVEPGLPDIDPSIPIVQPVLPIIEPQLPIIEPELPIVQPELPIVQPELPVIEPLPIIEPSLPIVEPELPPIAVEPIPITTLPLLIEPQIQIFEQPLIADQTGFLPPTIPLIEPINSVSFQTEPLPDPTLNILRPPISLLTENEIETGNRRVVETIEDLGHFSSVDSMSDVDTLSHVSSFDGAPRMTEGSLFTSDKRKVIIHKPERRPRSRDHIVIRSDDLPVRRREFSEKRRPYYDESSESSEPKRELKIRKITFRKPNEPTQTTIPLTTNRNRYNNHHYRATQEDYDYGRRNYYDNPNLRKREWKW